MRRKSPSSSPRLDCDVGLGLKMPADSYYCDGLYGGFADSLFAQRSFNNTASRGMGMGVCGKGVFTASQWEELERQKMIHKYILASIPVPPQLLLPTSSSRSPPPTSLSQCNSKYTLSLSLSLSLKFSLNLKKLKKLVVGVVVVASGLDLRFSSGGSDAEPWRCKRTDGKKWRCSRDVAPDLKYCERHAHKSRPRSRKLVEVSSHKRTLTPPPPPPASSYDQTRCIEWFMKGGSDTNSVSISTHKQQQQQWEHVMHPSSSRNNNKNIAFHHHHHSNFEDKEGDDFMSLNPYIPVTSNLHNPILDPKIKSLTQTRHFIDAWEKEGKSTKFPISPSSSSSSLSLSMCGGDYGSGKGDLGIGMISSERENEGVLKPQWMMNSVSWTNSPPGGPLGEVLCLGNATTTRGSYGYSNNTNTTNTNSSSICSKSSCEDGSYALNFIGDS